MANDKCKGCQSFCMLGHQLVLYGPDGKTKYNGGWLNWKNVKKGDSISSNQPNTTKVAISQVNQQDLINFIRNAYKEGRYNPQKGNLYENESKGKGLNIITNPAAQSAPSSLSSAESGASTGKIIYAHHYNDLLDCISDFHAPISEDPKGDSLIGNKNGNDGGNNAKQDGPVVGWPISADDLVISGNSEVGKNSDLSLIKADLYKGLYDKASKLMYHPYQCNMCNVYEGGDWLEIVKDIGTACYNYGIVYNNHAGGPVDTAKGYHVTLSRFDCSGYVGACLAVFNAVENGSSSTNISGYGGTSDAYLEDGSGIPASLKKYFSFSGSLPSKPGSILVRWAKSGVDPFGNRTEHVEIRGENGIWSGGGRGGPSGNLMMGKMDTGGTTCNFGWEYTGG